MSSRLILLPLPYFNGFDNGGTSGTCVSQSLKRYFLLCSLDSNSQGKLFIALILNVMLFGINITQTYMYYIHSKKCVSSLSSSYSSNYSMAFSVCLFQRSIVDQNIGGIMTFEPVFYYDSKLASVNRSSLSLWQTSFNRHSYLYTFIGP